MESHRISLPVQAHSTRWFIRSKTLNSERLIQHYQEVNHITLQWRAVCRQCNARQAIQSIFLWFHCRPRQHTPCRSTAIQESCEHTLRVAIQASRTAGRLQPPVVQKQGCASRPGRKIQSCLSVYLTFGRPDHASPGILHRFHIAGVAKS